MPSLAMPNKPIITSLLKPIHELVKADLDEVNNIINQQLHSKVDLINQVAAHIIQSGGKRLRPLLVLLSAKALGYARSNKHCLIAAIIELIHTATLLHDDVVDRSQLRRGRHTANAIWGDQASVLIGDFLYSRTFQMMASLENMRIMAIFAEATNLIASGEVMQLTNNRRIETSEADYLEVITCKTAKLFEAATYLGAIAANASKEQEQAMAKYGLHIGITFQLVDDILDYSAPVDILGKTIGNDLAEGKPTLPLLYALQNGNGQQTALLKQVFAEGGTENFTQVLEIIKDTHALDYTQQLANHHQMLATQALNEIPDSAYRQALLSLASFAANRNH